MISTPRSPANVTFLPLQCRATLQIAINSRFRHNLLLHPQPLKTIITTESTNRIGSHHWGQHFRHICQWSLDSICTTLVLICTRHHMVFHMAICLIQLPHILIPAQLQPMVNYPLSHHELHLCLQRNARWLTTSHCQSSVIGIISLMAINKNWSCWSIVLEIPQSRSSMITNGGPLENLPKLVGRCSWQRIRSFAGK